MKKIAIPVIEGVLSQHFGHCAYFELFKVENGNLVSQQTLEAPPHQPGLLPKWLAERGATDILAGGMGQRAIAIFNDFDITVHVGVLQISPQKLIEDYISGKLQTSENACDH
ncbi:MAG: ATPase [Candidatus Delongbacteria bacterium]|nr:ATPase [Candidatus Delongbacteria bacterium]